MLKTNYNKLIKSTKSFITTFKLSKNTYMFIASLANKAKKAAFALLSIINALALKTLVLYFSKNTL